MRNVAFAAGALLSVLTLGAVAEAAPVVYTDYSAWGAAVAHNYSVAIPDPGSAGFSDLGTGNAAVTYSGVTFSTSQTLGNRYFYSVGSSYQFFAGTTPVLSVQSADLATSGGVTNLLITLPMSVTAFAFNFGTLDGSVVNVSLLGTVTPIGSTLDFEGPHYQTPDFIGFTSTTPFTQILVTTSDRVLNLGTINFDAPVTSIPETQTWAMLLLGFGSMALFAMYRRRRESLA